MNSTGRFTPALRRLTHYRYDHCSQCNAALPVGKPSFAGYNAKQQEIYVGDCCVSQIQELASHIYWWWTSFKRPQVDTVIWRYMDFSKFLAIINDGALYFARVDTLGDPFEGARDLASRKDEWKIYCLNYYKAAILSAPGRTAPPSPHELELEAGKLYESMAEGGERELLNTYVSCWHANTGESEAQWRLYTPPQSAGIAVRTTM